jgi:uncharacterized membrane protein YphA (DoxX/SURF4 family)
MPFHVDGPAFSIALVRVALALYLLGAGLAMAGLPMPAPTQGQPWLPAANLGALTPVIVFALLACGALLVAGIESALVSLTVLAQLALFLTIWMIDNPLHNTMNHLVPFGAAALFIFVASERDRYRLGSRPARFRFSDQTRVSVLVLTARVYLGSVFLAQGVRSAFGRGLMNFAQALYVEPLAGSWIPEPLLWSAGLSNPIIQIAGGILLLLGVWTRLTAAVLGVFLLTIFFGHLLADPFDRGASVHAYAMANFLAAVAILWLQPRGDRFSIDALLSGPLSRVRRDHRQREGHGDISH